ncbi:hypothetical protein AAFN88_01590 [Pelagibius sp. CAU 1746]|uniref:hypothetical protein n=1 Tax=Pelagibius sp. CAU 1746 TaxID=3140370 RepID=UPI00325BCBDD
MRKLNVSLLSQAEVDQAFPLIRTICPDANLDAWRSFASQRIAQGSEKGTGILIVRNEQGCIVAIAAFLLSHDLVHGPILLADHFSALDIVDQGNVARALEAGLEKIARRHGCSAVHTSIPSTDRRSDDGWLCSVLFERGHRIEGLHMCKLLPANL